MGLSVAAVCFMLLLTAWRLHKSRNTQLFGELVTEFTTEDSVIALTFDDGPVSVYTDSVLALLERESVPATFFVIGRSVEEHPELIRQILSKGHGVGNHSYSHDRMVLMSLDRIRSEVEATDSLLREAGVADRIPFRPPYGKRLLGLPWYLWRTGRVTVLWSLEPDSWFRDRNDMVRHVVENVHPGAIILLHVEIGSRTEERAALPLLIRELKQQGYRFVTVSEMLGHGQNQKVKDAGLQLAHAPEVSTYPVLGGQLAPILESIDSAAALLRLDSGTLAADSSFIRFRRDLRDRLREVVPEFNDRDFQADVWPAGAAAMMRRREEQRPERHPTSEEEAQADSLIAVLEAHGLWAGRGEGDTYFSVNEALLLERLGPYLTRAMREFLELRAEEQRRPTAADAALMITPAELAGRIRRAEQFRADHRESLVWDVMDSRYEWYLNLYLGGLPNSPAFRRATGDLRPELRTSFEQYVAEHGSTPSGRLVADYLTMLEASNFQRSAAIDTLLAERWANRRLRPFP